jgi:hypothetical protein
VDLPLRAAGLVFPSDTQSRVVVLAATDAGSLRFDRDEKTHTFRTDFNILARVIDARGEVLRQASQPYRLAGPIQQIDQARRGEVLFFRQPAFGPGSYTLEVAVHDALATRSGVYRAAFVVPETTPQSLQVSSLVLVQRTERTNPEERQTDNPLYSGELLVYPNLGQAIRKSGEKAITCYAVVIPGSGAAPQATLEILREGHTVATAPLALPAAKTSGRIEHLAQLSIDTLSSGRYTLRLTVTQGVRREVRDAAFELID